MAAIEHRRPTALLMLDDSAEDRQIFKRLLASDPEREYVLSEHEDIESALAACRLMRPDCVLLDYALGDGTGLDFLATVRSEAGLRDVPVIMLTGSGSEDVAARAFRSGVQDYLAKGTVSADILQRAISAAIYQAKTERLLAEQRLELERLFREAQEANARKDQFLAALSHELRTPLTPILTAVSSVDPREAAPDELLETFSTIRRNVLLEARLIDDLLDITRIAKGKLILDPRPADAHEVLNHAIETCRDEIEKKELRLTLNFAAERHVLEVDAARLQQVFWNLLKNAVKFTPARGEIQISTRTLPSGHWELTVQDTGLGITAEALPKIFRAFEQGADDIPRHHGGLGLGLAIAQALVLAHHGRLQATSPGRGLGATFTVELPLSDQALPGPTAPDERPKEGTARPKGRVLLVEDHVDSARLLCSLMKRRGLEVVVATSIGEALDVFDHTRMDVVVSDIGLPDGSGTHLMAQLRQSCNVPGIALSGYGMEEDVARSRAAGFAEHLVKPIEWPKLDAALTRLLKSIPPAG